jgi:Ser/Thr protein kinase RdoA (MazF antagonist)
VIGADKKLLKLLPFLIGNTKAARHGRHEAPLRAELFSAEQMEHHGRTLASAHALRPRGRRDLLISRLAQNEAVLLETCDLLTTAIKAGSPITPAGEWLLDNFYLIEEQVRTARRHLPKGYSSELPRLANGPSAALPRVYDIALEAISHGDGRVDTESVVRFITAYQTVTPLNLGELWAIPIMLRLALIENLRRVGARVATASIGRNLADSWADKMTAIVERDPKSLVLVIADMARSDPPMTSGFVAELARRLQGQSPALALPLTWVEQRLAESGQTLKQLVQADGQQQAADQVSIANSIGSMRLLAVTDWREFVETVSIAERTLGEDPGGVYARMDFATRDRYRHVIEKIAKHSSHSEVEVAQAAVRLAQAAASETPAKEHEAHVGFYLIGKGLPQLERLVRMRRTLREKDLREFGRSRPIWLYLGPDHRTDLRSLPATPPARCARQWARTAGCSRCAECFVVLGASQLAVALVQLAGDARSPRRVRCRAWTYRAGIPAEARTLVVVPTMHAIETNIDDYGRGAGSPFLGQSRSPPAFRPC